MVGKTLHWYCDCLFKIDFVGKIIGYKKGPTTTFIVQDLETGKLIDIEETHPNMVVEEV